MDVFHLSHTDLDGYGCQLVTSELFSDIKFYNSNYGEEITYRLSQIIEEIKSSNSKESLLLITDLNLTLDESKRLDRAIGSIEGKKVTLTLLDHHASGSDSAQTYSWYNLDTTRSAAKITYDYFYEQKPKKISKKRWLKPTTDMINAIDIWLEDDKYFEFGKVVMRLISQANELNRYMFDIEHRTYKLKLLKWASKYLAKKDGHIRLDDEVIKLKKKYLYCGKKDILDNQISEYITKLLADKKEELKIELESKVGIFTYQLGSISTIANEFLKQNSDIDFVLDVNPKGNCSLRASGAIDLSKVSQKYFNGGGHPNASGGRIEGFKDCFTYEAAKERVLNYIKEKQNGQT